MGHIKQSDIFLQGEGQAWYERNKDKLPPEHDPVMDIIEKAGIIPNNVLEIGCGNGWRLESLFDKYKCNIYGIDPNSSNAYGNLLQGTGDYLPYRDDKFDLVIYGFCLYLVDREDLFKIVAEGDRVLQDGGYLVIHDFVSPSRPFKRKYKYRDGIFSYHMDYHYLWAANPTYKILDLGTVNDGTSVTILQKNIDKGWPLHE